MMIRLSRRLRGRNEGSSFLETLNLEHVWASDYSIKDCKKYLCCRILNKIVDRVETDFEGDDCLRCPPGFHCFFFPFCQLLHRTSAFYVQKSGRFDFVTRAMGPLLLSLFFFLLIRFRRAECESRYECKTECFDKKICQIRLTILILFFLLCPSLSDASSIHVSFIVIIFIVQGTSTSARSTEDMSAGTCGRTNAMVEDAGGKEARRMQEGAGGKVMKMQE